MVVQMSAKILWLIATFKYIKVSSQKVSTATLRFGSLFVLTANFKLTVFAVSSFFTV